MAIGKNMKRFQREMTAASRSDAVLSVADRLFYRPFGFIFAKMFHNSGRTAEQIRFIAFLISIFAGFLLSRESMNTNLVGIFFLVCTELLATCAYQLAKLNLSKNTAANIHESAFEKARMACIYLAFCFRLTDTVIPFFSERTWDTLIFPAAAVSYIGWLSQFAEARYILRSYLHFEGSETLPRAEDAAKAQKTLPWRGNLIKKSYLLIWGAFTFLRELATPQLQLLYSALRQKTEASEAAKQEYLLRGKVKMPYARVYNFSVQLLFLLICVLLNAPLLYFLLITPVFSILSLRMRVAFEKTAREILAKYALPGSEKPAQKRSYTQAIFFIIGALGIVMMLAKTDLSSIDWQTVILKRMYIWLPLTMLTWGVIHLLRTLTYRLMVGIRRGDIPFFKLAKITLSAFALSTVTPMGGMGGEPYRIVEMKPFIGAERAAAGSLLFSVFNYFTLIMAYITGAIVFLCTGCPGGVWNTVIDILLLAVCCAALFWFFGSGKKGMVLPAMNLLSKGRLTKGLAAKTLAKKREKFASIDREIIRFHSNRRVFLKTLFIGYFSRLLEILEYFILLKTMGCGISYAQSAVAWSFMSMVATLLFFIPMQVGTREGSLAMAFGWYGLAANLVVTASFMSRIRELIYLGIGISAMLLSGHVPQQEEAASDEPQTDESAPENSEEL